ncbi:hypothetical protein [Chamaesiphon minutus]|uniref:hypothetical protein n=1 Tax=Chamaesiphon minutus TaxID=1173032 RepID=UPI0003124555|nr:hypothetical protein [Chamaesiphon minutus]
MLFFSDRLADAVRLLAVKFWRHVATRSAAKHDSSTASTPVVWQSAILVNAKTVV